VILSRLPVGAVFRHLLPWPVDSAVPSIQRIALEATLLLPMRPVRICTTHLEWYSTLQRAAQVERLRELHAQASAHASSPGLLVGGFTFKPNAAESVRPQSAHRRRQAFLRRRLDIAHPGRAHPPSVGAHDKVQCSGAAFTMDFAFVSADLAGRVKTVLIDSHSDASDHQPVLLELSTQA
jgi:endonuclease/exonuclease/phosphatase family metal-dependent hydrolase